MALSSIGPILAVLILGMVYSGEGSYTPLSIPEVSGVGQLLSLFFDELPHYAREVALALLPMTAFFFLFQAFAIRMHRRPLIRIIVGIVYALSLIHSSVILRDDGPDGDLGYPATCELDDGTLMTVYYQKQHPGENCSILYTRWKL